MREILELQTGQVAFISGLMSGFSLSVAAHILRYGLRNRIAQIVFLTLMLTSLLFLLALYVDVRLTIELAGVESLNSATEALLSRIRLIGTSSATIALFLFVVAIGMLGWLASRSTGIVSSLMAAGVLATLWLIWNDINTLGRLLAQ